MSPPTECRDAAAALDRLLTAAVLDPALRGRLKADPAAVLGEAGLSLAPGVEVVVEEVASDAVAEAVARSTDRRLVLALPPLPDGALADEALDGVAGGGPLTGSLAGILYPWAALEVIGKTIVNPASMKAGLEAITQQLKDYWNDPNRP